jgi:seryl-tRNA(Sec) selenium transferase
MPAEELKKLARRIKGRLPKDVANVIDTKAASGGGSGPDEVFDSVGLSIESPSTPGLLQAALRQAPVPMVALVRDGMVIVDMATLVIEDAVEVADTIIWALERSESLSAKARKLSERPR